MIKINPIELEGNWAKGYALDIHTVSSEYLGDDDYGHPHFDTKRSELGELVIQLKYRDNKSVLGDIVNTASAFLKDTWKIEAGLDYIVPVPPSNLNRTFQPVLEIVDILSDALNIPICNDTLAKVKKTPELKEVVEYAKREEILKDAFSIQNDRLKGKNILLFDDLYRSGATLRVITEILYNKSKVKNVYVLTLTKTRTKR
jgi:predicted amidophosphoribosyltransferase